MKKFISILCCTLISLFCNSVFAYYGKTDIDLTNYMQLVFTPDTDGIQTYIDWLDSRCTRTLYVACYTFTSPEVVAEYLQLAKRGVKIHVILDKSEANAVKKEAPLIVKMKRAGIEVITTTSPQHQIMHLKMSIADSKWVESGSFNYTDIANKQSNVLEFNQMESIELAALYMKTWDEIYNFARNASK